MNCSFNSTKVWVPFKKIQLSAVKLWSIDWLIVLTAPVVEMFQRNVPVWLENLSVSHVTCWNVFYTRNPVYFIQLNEVHHVSNKFHTFQMIHWSVNVLLYVIGTLLETDFHQKNKNIHEMLRMSESKTLTFKVMKYEIKQSNSFVLVSHNFDFQLLFLFSP